MIEFHYQTDFKIDLEEAYTDWLILVIRSEDLHPGNVSYIFCSDDDLLKLNAQYLDHNYYTDILTFDSSVGEEVNGDIFISIDRVRDNANKFGVDVNEELRRVMVHGILHMAGYIDKRKADKAIMRQKEDEKLSLFHVEH